MFKLTTFTKKAVFVILAVSLIDLQLSYILAFQEMFPVPISNISDIVVP